MILSHDRLEQLVSDIFAAAGCGPAEHERIAHYLVEANLVGHDSHGVIRVPSLYRLAARGQGAGEPDAQRSCSRTMRLAVVDGQFGFGQVMGEQATKLGIDKARRQGVAVVALRNSGHLGRIGDWAEMAAACGQGLAPLRQHERRRHPGRPVRRNPAPAFGQPDRRGRSGRERPADHPRHLDLHDRRGQDQGRLQQGGEGPRRLHPRRRRAIRPTTRRRFTPRLPARSFRWAGTRGTA